MSDKTRTHEYSVCFLFAPDGWSVLLQTKNRTSFAGKLNGVGGKLERGETMLACARREIREKTGVDVPESKLVPVAVTTLNEDCALDDAASRCVLHFFAAVVNPGDVRPPEDATEPVAFYDTGSVLRTPVSHPAMAGHGDVQYVVNLAYRELNARGRFNGYRALPRLVDARPASRGDHLSVVHAEYEMPDHRAKTYELVTRHPDADIRDGAWRPDGVSILCFDRSGDYVLLEREFRMGVGGYVYNLPMGLIEPGESPEDAIRRELREETGVRELSLSPRNPRLPSAYTAPGMSNQAEQLFVGFANVDLREPTPALSPASASPHEFVRPLWADRETVRRILYDTSSDRTPFSSRTQALLHGWLCGADYVGTAR